MKSYYNQSSENLTFRAIEGSDVKNWVGFFEGNDRLNFLGIDSTKPSLILAQEWIDRQRLRYKEEGYGLLIVSLKTTDEIIGMGGIIPRTIKGLGEFEIAYSIKPAFWGNGYATEIAQHLKSYGTKIAIHHRMISQIHPENEASIKVARKNGMRKLFEAFYLGQSVEVYGVDI